MSSWSSASPHPIAALAAWRADGTQDGRTRALASGAGLARVLVSTGLITVDELAACVVAQCAAPPPADALRFVIESDLFCVAHRATNEATLANVSDAVLGSWLDQCSAADSVHAALLDRRLSTTPRDLTSTRDVIARVRWFEPLLRVLERRSDVPAAIVDVIARGVVERVERLLPPDYLPGVLARLAIATRDIAFLARARAELATQRMEDLCTNPDREHPAISVACAEAALGDVDGALVRVRALDEDERLAGLISLAEVGPACFVAVRDELLTLRAKLDVPWWHVVQPLPLLTPDAIDEIARMPPHEHVHEWFAIAPSVSPENTRDVCARGVTALDAFGSPIDLDASVDAWRLALERLDRCNAPDLLDVHVRARLFDAWRARTDDIADDMAEDIAPFVPDVNVDDVIAHAERRLRDALTWTERDAWLACGMRLHERAEAPWRERWLDAAADALGKQPPDRVDDDALAPFPHDTRREIVLRALVLARSRFTDASGPPR